MLDSTYRALYPARRPPKTDLPLRLDPGIIVEFEVQGHGRARIIRMYRVDDAAASSANVVTFAKPSSAAETVITEVAEALRATGMDASGLRAKAAALALQKAVGDASLAAGALIALGIRAPGWNVDFRRDPGGGVRCARERTSARGHGTSAIAIYSRYDTFERRIEFRRLTDRGREAVILDRLVCRSCLRAEVQERRGVGRSNTVLLF